MAKQIQPYTLITDGRVFPDVIYPGSVVSNLVNHAKQQERLRLLNELKPLLDSRDDTISAILAVDRTVQNIAEIVLLLKPGQTLRAWIVSRKIYSKLTGNVKHMNDVIEHYAKSGNSIIAPDDILIAEINSFSDDLLKCILSCQEGWDSGAKLMQWVEARAPQAQQFLASMRHYVKLGGADEKPHLQALYRLAYPLWLKHKNSWSGIVKTLWAEITSRTDLERNPDQRMVYAEWEGLTHKQRKDQISYIMSNPDDFEGI